MLLSSGVLLPTLNLRPYFHTIAKGESHLAVRIDRCVIHKPVEQLPYPLLVQMGHGAFAFAFELGVALPYRPFILAVELPDLGAKVFTKIAFQLCREWIVAVIAPFQILSPLYLHLHELPLCRINDGTITTLYNNTMAFLFIRLAPLRKGIHRVALLQTGISFILFI